MWRLCLTRLQLIQPVRLRCRQVSFVRRTNFQKIDEKKLFSHNVTVQQNQHSKNLNYFIIYRQFQLSQRRDVHPLVWVIARPIFKLLALLTGRGFRKWWKNLPPNRKKYVYSVIKKNRSKIFAGLAFGGGLMGYYYISHVEETPITKRHRFIAFNSKQMKQIGELELKQVLKVHENAMLSSNHPSCRRVAFIVRTLLQANKEIPELRNKSWTISVVDSLEENAFVLPNGEIFVFSGMLKLCSNDDQLGTVLAHEMSHCILAHGAENFSLVHLIDCVMIGVIGAIWAILPSDIFALFTYWLVNQLVNILLNLPYNRKIETEADDVGLQLSAKACLDVRESSAFWAKMAVISKTMDEMPQVEFLSTHPSHETRSNHLDSIMNQALQLRSSCGCPTLKSKDPRLNIELLTQVLEQRKMLRAPSKVVIIVPPGAH